MQPGRTACLSLALGRIRRHDARELRGREAIHLELRHAADTRDQALHVSDRAGAGTAGRNGDVRAVSGETDVRHGIEIRVYPAVEEIAGLVLPAAGLGDGSFGARRRLGDRRIRLGGVGARSRILPLLTLLQQSSSAFDRAVNNFTAFLPIAC